MIFCQIKSWDHFPGRCSVKKVKFDDFRWFLGEFSKKKWKISKNQKSDGKNRFLDLFGELEGHTRGEKIFPYLFCIVSHPQKLKTVLKKICFVNFSEKIQKKTKKYEKHRFLDLFGELEAHTRGDKIFSYVFCIVSHPQKLKTT